MPSATLPSPAARPNAPALVVAKRRARRGLPFPLLIPALALLLVLAAFQPAMGQNVMAQAGSVQNTPKIALSKGKSVIVTSLVDIARVSVAEPTIADFILLSPRQVYVTGKGAGVTNLTLWDGGNRIRNIYDLEVTSDVTLLKKALHDALPDEDGISVIPAGESISLSGTMKSAANVTRAMTLAEAYAPGKVVNLIQVAGVQQVMLEVRVAEMSRSLMKRMGFNFQYLFKGDKFYSFLNNLTFLDDQGRLILSPKVAAAFSITSGNVTWNGFLDALKEDGMVRILAEPTLICLSGQNASFLAGGEIPIPVPQGLGSVAIEYKPFGVGLKFTPTVLAGNKISMQVNPEVSELDYTNAITIQSFTIPAISTRRAATMVELDDGQTFAIAGLLKTDSRELADRFPFIGDVPVLGTLFKSTSFQKNDTELVILITPHLVKPMDKQPSRLPTDNYREKDDLEFYFGIPGTEKRAEAATPDRTDAPRSEGYGLDGRFGHGLPGESGAAPQ